jgi:hypothetical protein
VSIIVALSLLSGLWSAGAQLPLSEQSGSPAAAIQSEDARRHLAVVPLPNHAAVHSLPRGLGIRDVTDSSVSIVANDDELARLRTLGYSPRITVDDYQAWIDSTLLVYRTYAQVCTTMAALARTYPLVCRLDTLGFSVQNRAIPMMRVTRNPQVEEAEPEFRILGPHHGDEKIATEITLSFLQYVLASYDTSAAIHGMIDSTELWVVPIVNVDGFVLNQRENANYVDINRDYGYRWNGDSPSPFSQQETRLVRKHDMDNNIAIEFDYHSAAAYVNYLWDNHPADPPDSNFIAALAAEYADSTYGSHTTQLDPINGWDWYEADGTCQDASFGLFGNIAYTIETDQPNPQAKIDSICIANRRALLGVIRSCHLGVSGAVRDSLTGTPLFARISVDSPLRWDCYTDQTLGDFHKPLPVGTYTLTAHAQGYLSKTVAGVVVPAGGTATTDFVLAPDTAGQVCIEELVWLTNGEPGVTKRMGTTSIFALGAPDNQGFSLGRIAEVCLSAGRGRAIGNLPGDDVTVFDSDSIADGYWLYAGSDWAGPWTRLGHANGTNSFDIGSSGLDSARFVRIVCDSTSSPSDPKAGLDLDAVSYAAARTGMASPSSFILNPSSFPSVFPNPANRVLHVALPPATRYLKIIDIAGRAVECYRFGRGLSPNGDCTQGSCAIDVMSAGLEPGVYLARFETATGTSQLKFVVARP